MKWITHADVGVANQDVEAGLHSLRGTSGEEDVIGVRGKAIALGDELGNILPDVQHSLRVAVRANAANSVAQHRGPADGVGGEQLEDVTPHRLVQEVGHLEQGAYLRQRDQSRQRRRKKWEENGRKTGGEPV